MIDPVYIVPAPLSKMYCQSSSSKTKSLVTQAQSVLVGVPSTSKAGLNNILIDISDSESEINEPVQGCISQPVEQEKASVIVIREEKASEGLISTKNSEILIADDIDILFDKKGKEREEDTLKEPKKSSIINDRNSSVDLPGSSMVVVNDENIECSNDVLKNNLCEELIPATKLPDSSRVMVNDKNIECSNDALQKNLCKKLSLSTKLPDRSRLVIDDKNNECSNDVSQDNLCKEPLESTKFANSSFGTNSRPGNTTIEEITIDSDSDGETHISLNESSNKGPSASKTTSLGNLETDDKNQIRTIIFTMASHASKEYDKNLKIAPEICQKIPEDVKNMVQTEGKLSLFLYL